REQEEEGGSGRTDEPDGTHRQAPARKPPRQSARPLLEHAEDEQDDQTEGHRTGHRRNRIPSPDREGEEGAAKNREDQGEANPPPPPSECQTVFLFHRSARGHSTRILPVKSRLGVRPWVPSPPRSRARR